MFKVNTNDSRGMISFCSGVDRVPWYRFQANFYLFKVNNIHIRISCGICSKLTINSTEFRRPDVFIDNFEHVSLLILVFLLLTLGICLFDRLDTAQKMKFSSKDFFSKCDQIRSFLKKSLMENSTLCAVWWI